MNPLAKKLKDYAEAHYNEGWDTFVECFEDDEYEEFVGEAATWKEVKAAAEDFNSVIAERRADAAYEIKAGG